MQYTPKYIYSVIALSALSLHANDIEPSKEYYNATFIPNSIVIDGSLDEWTGVPVLSDPKFAIPKSSGTNGTYVLFEPYNGGTWSGPDDQTSAVQVVWDADNLYLGVTVTDDYHENSANSPWNGDSIQLMIADSKRAKQIALYNYALGGVEEALGDIIVQTEAGPGGTSAMITRNTDTKKTVYEIQMPASALGMTKLTAGTQIGLGMAINDGDKDTPGQCGWGGLGCHALVFGKSPSETALLTLSTNVPGADRLFFSAINPTIESITFRENDKGISVVNTNTVKLTLDGTVVPLQISAIGSGTIDYIYTPTTIFAPGSEHTYIIEATDTNKNTVTVSDNFKVASYIELTSTDKVTPNTAKTGFIFNIHQNSEFTDNDSQRPLEQLAGLLGDNYADAAASTGAIGSGTAGTSTTLPIKFEVSSVINFSVKDGSSTGDVQPDIMMPGQPGLDGTTDGVAAEILTYVTLPAGKSTLIVNSDDGFKATMGAQVRDVFLGKVVAEYEGGRGASDTSFPVYTAEAGVYPLRVVYENGDGDGNVEVLCVTANGTKVLVNDTDNGGIVSYRATTTKMAPDIIYASPASSETDVDFTSPITLVIQDADTAVDASSVKLSVNGALVTPTVGKTNGLTQVTYTPSSYWTSGAQYTASVSFTASGVTRTQVWSFTTISYATLTKAQQATSVTKTKPGFLWYVFQNENYQLSSLAETEEALAGEMVDSTGTAVENYADPNATGIASDVGVQVGALYKFEIPTFINMSQNGGDSTGHFTPDDQMPGIPGLTGANDGIEGEVITFVDFPAGLITMGVVSDDSFRMQVGYINKPADGIILGQADGSTADTTFQFYVKDAGIYPVRVIWQEGGGGANLELFTVDADGNEVLLNDTANGGYAAYRIGTAPNKPTTFSMAVTTTSGKVQITWTESGATLQQSSDLKTWTDVSGATSPYTPTISGTTAMFYRLKE